MEAPVSASQGAMRSLPMKLESLLTGPEHGLRAEEKKLRILQGDLQGLIDNYLLEPSEVESPASTANSWMEGVRDLSYDIDDFIYELAHVAGGGARINVVQKPPRFRISRFSEKLRRRQWITDEISGFRTRVKEAIRRHKDYLGSNCKWRPSSIGQPPPPSPPSRDAANAIHLVGVDSSMEELCSWLANDGRPEHKVASIVGPGGVGKTTLAKQVYRMLAGQFDCRAFMRTSRKPDMKALLASILSQVRRHRLPDDDACDVHDLVLNINAHLQDKTYLIVIEDLWALSTWDLVNRSLPKGNRCSRILTTTEVQVIAQACCADNSNCIPATKEDNSRYIIKKEPLSEDESRELFLSTAFGKQAECPQHLKEVSNEIIKRSGGLPLVINILASLLARQPASSIEQWNYMKNSLSSTLSTNASLERINQVLNLGYNNLPHGLKACMLYLCLYEEGCIIWKHDLVKQWIAEGFIGAVEGDKGEEVAHSYFGELVNRGMIQPVDINCNDEILSCTVHHIVLRFIRDKSMEENFCIAVEDSQTTIRLADKVRRMALHFGNVEDAMPPGPESMRLSKVRSVAFSGFLRCMPSIVEFRFLQVLILKLLVDHDKMSDDLSGSGDLSGNITEPDDLSDNLTQPDDLSYNLTEISELFRLRYFHLDACHMSVALPTQMQRLKDLVAWEIDAEVTAVPSDIVDLPGLLYLSIPSEAHLPTGVGRMTSLRTMGVFNLSKNSTETVMSLSGLTNLQDLRLTCSTLQSDNLEKNLESLGSVVRNLRNLKRVTLVPAVSSLLNSQDDAYSSSMSISWLGFSIQPLPPALLQTLELSRRCCIFSSLPEWTKELTNLRILKIAVRELWREDIAILKGLPSLAALSLFISSAPASRIMFDDEGFSVLKYFKFVCAVPCLAFFNGAMPKVRKVKLGFNANRMKGYSLDDAGFERLMSLTEISIKIRGTRADEHNRRSTQLVLTDPIGKDPRISTINVQWVDWDFFGDEEMYIEAQKEMGKWTSAKQGMTTGESSDEHAIQEKNLEEDAKKQADTRTCMPPESTLRPQNTDIKLSIIEKNTDRIAKKNEVDNDGYGDIYKLADVLPCPTVDPNMAAEVGNIKNKHKHFGFMPKDSRTVQQVPDRETSDVEEESIITRTEEKQKILSILSGSMTEEMVILPIYGIGGIGKTTLAQLVFNDTHFQGCSRVWVHVPQEFDLNKIGNSIISQLTNKTSDVANMQVLHKRLRDLFAGKRILIVLDDLWEEDSYKLDKLKAMLRLGLGSKVIVIVTTRDKVIAVKICSSATPYKLERLTDDMCWSIIKQKSSFNDRHDKDQLNQIGKDIAIKCGGVGLAARSLGYMLRDMTSDEWESVRDSYIWNLSSFEDPTSRNHEVLASLMLSYSYMPDWLKLCFSYCAIFPKGYIIAKYDLIHQWIALGFVESSRVFDSLQLCEIYVIKLLEMSFLEYSKACSSNGRQDNDVTLLTMPNIVHDLASAILANQVNDKGGGLAKKISLCIAHRL